MQTVDREILAALSWTPEPLTSTDLVNYCPSALDRTCTSRAVHRLRTGGLIESVEERQSHEGRGARPIKAYRITEAGQDILDNATEAKMNTETAIEDMPVLDEDPVITELLELRQRPAIDHGEAHAERLRTLAERLRLIDERTELTQLWLRGLADMIYPDGSGR